MDRKVTFILIGTIFWLTAAILMHFIVPYIYLTPLTHILFWLANFLVPALFLPLIARLTDRLKADMLAPTALMALPAMTLDGVSITLDTLGKTHIYANSSDLAGLTGGFLLFAFASFFFWAIIWHKA